MMKFFNIINHIYLGFNWLYFIFDMMIFFFMINHNIDVGGLPCKVQKVKISLFILLKQEKNYNKIV